RRVLEGEAPSTQVRLDARRAEAVRLLNLSAVAPARYEHFWRQLDVPYFLRNDPQDVAWHTRVLHPFADTTVPVVRARGAPIGEGFQVVVYQPDQPDLFARICGYFDSKNLSVLDAKIHTTEHGYALDSFVLVDPTGSAQYRDILSLVEAELAQRLAAGGELPISAKDSRSSFTSPTSRTCSRASAAISTARTCRCWTRRSTRPSTAMRSTASCWSTRPDPRSTATSCRWSKPSWPSGWRRAASFRSLCAGAARGARATSRSNPRSTFDPASAATSSGSRSSPTTARACSTASRACSVATGSACTPLASPRSANASRTCS